MKKILALFLLFPLCACALTVYKSVDSHGNVVFSQNPTPSSVPVVVQNPQAISLPASTSDSTPPPVASSSPVNSTDSSGTSVIQSLNQQIDQIQQLQQQIQQATINVSQAQSIYDAATQKVEALTGQPSNPPIVVQKPEPMQGSDGVTIVATRTKELIAAQTAQQNAYQNLMTAQQTLNYLKQELIHVQQNQ